jgi:hypothetical protein
VALLVVVRPPGHRVSLSQCPTADAGCIVTVDNDLTTFAAVLAGLGAVAVLISLLGVRFNTVKVAGTELSHAPETEGLGPVPPPTAAVEEPEDVARARGALPTAPPAPIEVRVEQGVGTVTGTAPIAVSRLKQPIPEVDPRALRDYQSARKRSQKVHFLTHVLGPATHPNQMYSVAIRVTPRKEAADTVRSASFYLGRTWGSKVFEGSRGQDGRLGITTDAYGPFLVLCEVEFDDGERILLDHYCDFDMGPLVPFTA